VWATRISFLDVLSAVPPFLSHAMPGNINPRKGGTARSLNQQVYMCTMNRSKIIYIHVFNYITDGDEWWPPTKPFCTLPRQSSFSLKYKQNMEYRREVWYLCESYALSFIFNAVLWISY
jgi:hypothetical protein